MSAVAKEILKWIGLVACIAMTVWVCSMDIVVWRMTFHVRNPQVWIYIEPLLRVLLSFFIAALGLIHFSRRMEKTRPMWRRFCSYFISAVASFSVSMAVLGALGLLFQPALRMLELRLAIHSADGFFVQSEDLGAIPNKVRVYTAKAGELGQILNRIKLRRSFSPFGLDAPYTWIVFTKGTNEVSTLVLLGGEFVEWRWGSVHILTDQSAQELTSWLADRGVVGPRDQRAREAQIEREESLAVEKWLASAPPVLKSFLLSTSKIGNDPDPGEMNRLLSKDFPEPAARIRVLLEWFGAGKGPWSGFPDYETFPERMLFLYSTSDILAASQTNSLTEHQTEGLARFLAGWDFATTRRQDLQIIPTDLKNRLLEHSLQSDDEDKKSRAMKAFGPVAAR